MNGILMTSIKVWQVCQSTIDRRPLIDQSSVIHQLRSKTGAYAFDLGKFGPHFRGPRPPFNSPLHSFLLPGCMGEHTFRQAPFCTVKNGSLSEISVETWSPEHPWKGPFVLYWRHVAPLDSIKLTSSTVVRVDDINTCSAVFSMYAPPLIFMAF